MSAPREVWMIVDPIGGDEYHDSEHEARRWAGAGQEVVRFREVLDAALATPPAVSTEAVVWVDAETRKTLDRCQNMAWECEQPLDREDWQRLCILAARCRVATEVGHG